MSRDKAEMESAVVAIYYHGHKITLDLLTDQFTWEDPRTFERKVADRLAIMKHWIDRSHKPRSR